MPFNLKIERIEPLRFQKNHQALVLKDGASHRVHMEILAQYRLKAGMEVSEELLKEVLEANARKEALDYAMLLLNYRDLSERALRERLKRKGFGVPAADWVVERLKSQKLLDDAELARRMAEQRIRNQPLGDARIRSDLLRRGIDARTAEQAMREAASSSEDVPSEEERALELVRRRLRQIRAEDDHAVVRRLYGYLARRGFPPDVIERALDRARRPPGESDRIE